MKSVIVVQEHSPNEVDTLRIFHTRFEISASPSQHFMRPLRPSSENYLNQVGVPGKYLIRELMSLDGVDMIFIHPYDVAIGISPAFNFEEIEPKVLEILEMYIPKDILKEKRPLVSYLSCKPNSKEKDKIDTPKSGKRCISFKKIWKHIQNFFRVLGLWFKNTFKQFGLWIKNISK